MPKYRAPNEEECRIIRENGIDPDTVIVSFRTETAIHLLCFKTRDEITIRKGDRAWS